MAYKRIRVYDGSEWIEVGAQVPGVTDAVGSGQIVLSAGGTGQVAIPFGLTFAFAPQVFAQVTGVNHATIAITADTVGFTADVVGTPNDTVTFDWFAVQADFS